MTFNWKIFSSVLSYVQFSLVFRLEESKVLGGKLKKKEPRDIYKGTLDIEFVRDRSIGLGSMFGDGKTKTHTHIHTHTFFLKHIFWLWEWCRMKNHQKMKSKNLTIAILTSLLMSLESKNWTFSLSFFYYFFKIHCYLETLQHLGHIPSRVFGCVPEGCVFLLLCCQCFIC